MEANLETITVLLKCIATALEQQVEIMLKRNQLLIETNRQADESLAIYKENQIAYKEVIKARDQILAALNTLETKEN